MTRVTSFDWRITQVRRSRKPPEINSGGFLGFDDTICRELLYPMLRTLVASAVLMAITIMLLHATHHGAHARSATHCGFWTEIEAGLSCR